MDKFVEGYFVVNDVCFLVLFRFFDVSSDEFGDILSVSENNGDVFGVRDSDSIVGDIDY